jgi:hypothetical protein
MLVKVFLVVIQVIEIKARISANDANPSLGNMASMQDLQ